MNILEKFKNIELDAYWNRRFFIYFLLIGIIIKYNTYAQESEHSLLTIKQYLYINGVLGFIIIAILCALLASLRPPARIGEFLSSLPERWSTQFGAFTAIAFIILSLISFPIYSNLPDICIFDKTVDIEDYTLRVLPCFLIAAVIMFFPYMKIIKTSTPPKNRLGLICLELALFLATPYLINIIIKLFNIDICKLNFISLLLAITLPLLIFITYFILCCLEIKNLIKPAKDTVVSRVIKSNLVKFGYFIFLIGIILFSLFLHLIIT